MIAARLAAVAGLARLESVAPAAGRVGLHLVFGPRGAGKSTYARALAGRERGLRLGIDDWMVDLFTPDMPGAPDLDWIGERVARCERRLLATAPDVLAAGTPVVLDLGGMSRAHRDRLAAWARDAGLPARRHFLLASRAVREARVAARDPARGPAFPFEVTPAMFAWMEHRYEPPAADELAGAVVVDTSAEPVAAG
ncbi:MAG: AAA family ATPase [Burkholderiaceae bacterium]